MASIGVGGARLCALAAVALLVSACSTGPGASDRAADLLTSRYPTPPGWTALAETLHGSDGSYGRVREVNQVPVLFVGKGDGFEENRVLLRYTRAVGKDADQVGTDAGQVCRDAAGWFVAVDSGLSARSTDVVTVASSCAAAVASPDQTQTVATGAGDDEHDSRKLTWGVTTRRTEDGTVEVLLGLTYDSSR